MNLFNKALNHLQERKPLAIVKYYEIDIAELVRILKIRKGGIKNIELKEDKLLVEVVENEI